MRKRWRIIAVLILLSVALVVYIVITFTFAASKEDETLCNNVNVIITNESELKLVSTDDVLSILNSSDEIILGTAINNINIAKIKEVFDGKSYIKSINIYTTADGALNIKITQRVPFVRVHTANGAFYMDSEAYVFPLSNSYSHYVPVVTGNIPLPFSMPYKGELPDKEESKTLRDLLSFVVFLNNDSFWNAEIEQIHVLPNADVELIPRTGNHIIRLGKFDGYEYKLKKLFTFYKNALPLEGWNKYSVLDLRYSNQVVGVLSIVN